MNPIEIAVRNYLANTLGASSDMIDMLLLSPEFRDVTYEHCAAMITGPYGTLLTNPTAEMTADTVEDTLNGYVNALQETIAHIDGMELSLSSESSVQDVWATLWRLKADIMGRIEEVEGKNDPIEDEPEPESAADIEQLESILSIFFGKPVKLVRFEQAQG